jgi:hypothetical protein
MTETVVKGQDHYTKVLQFIESIDESEFEPILYMASDAFQSKTSNPNFESPYSLSYET